jgi:hypothetical protein
MNASSCEAYYILRVLIQHFLLFLLRVIRLSLRLDWTTFRKAEVRGVWANREPDIDLPTKTCLDVESMPRSNIFPKPI